MKKYKKPIVDKKLLDLLPEELRNAPIGDIYQAIFYGNITGPLKEILENKIGLLEIPQDRFNETLEELANPHNSPQEGNQKDI